MTEPRETKAIVIVRGWERRLHPSAYRNDRTLSELSAEYGVSFMQIGRWKKTLSDRASELFETGSSMDLEKITDPLYKEIGRLKMDIEWLKKKRGGIERR